MTPGAPPPSTPDPRRFLLSRRAPAGSQQETPAPRQFQTPGGPATGSASSQRFLTTPRFAPASSSAANASRPPAATQAFLLPGSIRATQRRQREPICDDVLDSSPTAAGSSPPLAGRDARESVDGESEGDAGLRGQSIVTDSFGDGSLRDGPALKRRRVDLSSVLDEESDGDTQQHHDEAVRLLSDTEEAPASPSIRKAPGELNPMGDEMLLDAPTSPLVQSWEEEMELSDHEDRREADAQQQQKQQPTFQRAPRFMPTEKEETVSEGLPEAFSPQRRGAKYVHGGLAAEMQSWLADVRGWTGHDRPPDAVMRIVVEEVRPGNRMYLVQARRMPRDRNEGAAEEEVTGPALRIMLAGEGKLTGLARRAVVEVGSVIVVSQPVWEVVLDGQGRWVVACEWAVEHNNEVTT